jgi:hypothetical protein
LPYYLSINDYNRAQFQLYHALGQPAQFLPAQGGVFFGRWAMQ